MKICVFAGPKSLPPRAGIIVGDSVLEAGPPFDTSGRKEVLSAQEFLDGGPELWARSEKMAKSGTPIPLAEVKLLAPLPRPPKILLAIVNTRGMLGGSDVSLDRPRLDLKASTLVIGPGDAIIAPKEGIRPEVELAAVVGKKLAKATKREAEDGIFGYTIFNDVTAPADTKSDSYEAYRRDPQTNQIRKTTVRGPLFRSKNHDTFGPMGPFIVSSDELGDTGSLRLTTKFNGETIQDGNTSEYIFTPEEIASYASRFLTLFPGDLVSCGSVGWVQSMLEGVDPSQWVLPSRDGELELTIEGIGTLRNRVVPE
ncbi:MAG: fumarylacetoacetate hydrolase family protein [Thaumarchaeota archaeon]|nr:fumarylacetoacetate hydrolase family protein [Nitrososphaerota archaeon]